MFGNEIRRLWCKQRIWLIVLMYLIAHCVLLLTEQSAQVQHDAVTYRQYQQLLHEYAGQLTMEKEDEITERYRQIQAAQLEQTRLFTQYNEQTIFADEYAAALSELQPLLQEADAFAILYEQYLFATESPKNRWLIDRIGWETLLGTERTDFLLMLVIVLVTALLFCEDYACGIADSIAASVGGRQRLCSVRLFLACAVSGLTCLLANGMEVLICAIRFGLPSPAAPMQSLVTFSTSPYELQLHELLRNIVLVKLLGAIALCCICAVIAILLKRELAVMAGAVLFFTAPYALFSDQAIRYQLPHPLGLFQANGYFRGSSEMTFNEEWVVTAWNFDAVSLKAAVISVFGCMIVAILLFSFAQRIYTAWFALRRSTFTAATAVVICGIGAIDSYYKMQPLKESFHTAFSAEHSVTLESCCMLSGWGIHAVQPDYEIVEFPLALYTEESTQCRSFYADEQAVYLLIHDSDSGTAVITRVDAQTFHETVIYEETSGNARFRQQTHYLDLIRQDNWQNASWTALNQAELQNFWLDGDWLYLERGAEIARYHLRSKKYETLMTDYHRTGKLAVTNGVIYNLDLTNTLCSYDIASGKQRRYPDVRCLDIQLWQGGLLYKALDSRLYTWMPDTQETQQLSEQRLSEASRASVCGDRIYFVGSDGFGYCYENSETVCVYSAARVVAIGEYFGKLLITRLENDSVIYEWAEVSNNH